MKKYQEHIDDQFEFNQGKNLFHPDVLSSFRFSPGTLKAIEELDYSDPDEEHLLIDYLTNRALDEFCKMNQYYTFGAQAREALKNLYVELFANLKRHTSEIDSIAEAHYKNIKNWLQESNPYAEKLYSAKGEMIQPVVCAEYTPGLQTEVLHIDIDKLMGPVLDIGCGKQGSLVIFLRNLGMDATGLDRFSFSDDYLMNADWLEFEYGIEKWGTILSNLGFSNHFKHHHLREDGNPIAYARKYIEILKSLKIGGSFHYAPDLPFIELYLDKQQFQVEKFEIGNFDFKTTVIKRLK